VIYENISGGVVVEPSWSNNNYLGVSHEKKKEEKGTVVLSGVEIN